jgi:two-component system heavy metal sensor histidine kinase CusS
VVQGWRAEIALGTARDDALLLQLRWILGLAAVFGALVISAGGAWLVRVGLAPLRHLSEQLQYLRASSLSQRLDGSGQVLELQPVIGEFNALLSRLDDSYRQLEGFNADVAHELKTPLANLISSCELGLRKSRDLAALRDLLGDNLEELHRLSGMVNDMLFLAQADRARGHAAPGRPAWPAWRGCPGLPRGCAAGGAVAMGDPGDVAASVDAGLLRRALSNLLSNATRYAHTGSTVIVEIQAQGGQVEVRVRNTGPEIASAELARIFDRFYRADVSRAMPRRTTVWGLSIVSAIARMHGGHTLARSDQGETCIGLALPQGAPGPGADQFISRRLQAT